MSGLTLRGRVLLATVLVLAVALAGLGAGFNVLLRDRLASDASAVLRSRAAAQRATIEIRGGRVRVEERPGDAALDHQAWVLAGGKFLEQPANADPALSSAVRSLGTVTRRRELTVGGATRLLAQPVRDGRGARVATVAVGLSLVPYHHTATIALIASLILSVVLLGAAVLAVRWALRAALRPVAEMTRRAADWSEHDLHRRFELGPPRDELTALADTFDQLLRRIESVLRREQQLTAEIAHELRTPLAGVRGEAELALAATDLAPDARRGFAEVLAGTERMEGVIETLLDAARSSRAAPAAAGSCDPVPAVREALAAIAPSAEARAVALRLEGPEAPVRVDAAPDLLVRALMPLLENGARHARSELTVSIGRRREDVTVTIADDGPGLTSADVFEPGFSTIGGAGLGLPLARRLARGCGGDVDVVEGPGARFELSLPGAPAA